jgi:5-methylcytosine-specific restriction endonuclease McrA
MSKAWSGGSDTRWRRLRRRVLRLDLPVGRRPRCAVGLPVCTDLATCVDHVVPLHMGGDKYDEANCRPSCEPCNLARGKRAPRAPEPPTRKVSNW